MKLKNDLTADELDAVLRVASAAQTQLADDEQIVALGAQAVKLAMARVDLDRLSLQDFLRLQALVLQLSDKTDDGIGFTARWVTASDQHQRADFYQTHQLITLLRQGKGRTVNTALDRLAAHRQSALAGMYYKTFGAVRDQLVHESGRTGDQAAQYRAELTAEYLLAGEMWHLESYEALGAIHEDVLAHGDGKQIAAARLVLRDGRDKPLGRMPFNQFMTFLRRTADPAAMPEEAATYVAGYVIGGDEWRSLDYATQLDLRALLDKGRGDKVNVARTVMADQLPRTFRDQRLGQLGHYLRSGRAEIKSPQVREELIVRYVLESDRWRESDFPGMVELVHWLEGNEHDDQPKAVDRVLTHVRKSLENYAAPDDSGTSLGLRIENPRNHSGVIREILELVVGQLTDDGKAAVMAGVQRRFAIDVQRRIQFGDWETHLWAIVLLRLNNFGGQLAALEPQAAEKLLIASGGHPAEGSGGGPLMAMVLGKSFSAYGDREQWKALIRSKISDQSIVGDDRVIWHLAGAYMDETEGGATATPLSGWPLLQTAFAAAQSEYWRLQCINWMVSRRLAVQQYDEAKSLIQSVRQQFDTDSAQAQFDHLAKLIEVEREIEAERLEKVTRQLQRVRAKARLDIYSAELAKAREQNRGPADIEHLERLVSRFEQQLAELDSAAGD